MAWHSTISYAAHKMSLLSEQNCCVIPSASAY